MTKNKFLEEYVNINEIKYGSMQGNYVNVPNENMDEIDIEIDNEEIYPIDYPHLFDTLPKGLNQISLYLVSDNLKEKLTVDISNIGFKGKALRLKDKVFVERDLLSMHNFDIGYDKENEAFCDKLKQDKFHIYSQIIDDKAAAPLKTLNLDYWILSEKQKIELDKMLKTIISQEKIKIKDLLAFENEFNIQVEKCYKEKYDFYKNKLAKENVDELSM